MDRRRSKEEFFPVRLDCVCPYARDGCNGRPDTLDKFLAHLRNFHNVEAGKGDRQEFIPTESSVKSGAYYEHLKSLGRYQSRSVPATIRTEIPESSKTRKRYGRDEDDDGTDDDEDYNRSDENDSEDEEEAQDNHREVPPKKQLVGKTEICFACPYANINGCPVRPKLLDRLQKHLRECHKLTRDSS